MKIFSICLLLAAPFCAYSAVFTSFDKQKNTAEFEIKKSEAPLKVGDVIFIKLDISQSELEAKVIGINEDGKYQIELSKSSGLIGVGFRFSYKSGATAEKEPTQAGTEEITDRFISGIISKVDTSGKKILVKFEKDDFMQLRKLKKANRTQQFSVSSDGKILGTSKSAKIIRKFFTVIQFEVKPELQLSADMEIVLEPSTVEPEKETPKKEKKNALPKAGRVKLVKKIAKKNRAILLLNPTDYSKIKASNPESILLSTDGTAQDFKIVKWLAKALVIEDAKGNVSKKSIGQTFSLSQVNQNEEKNNLDPEVSEETKESKLEILSPIVGNSRLPYALGMRSKDRFKFSLNGSSNSSTSKQGDSSEESSSGSTFGLEVESYTYSASFSYALRGSYYTFSDSENDDSESLFNLEPQVMFDVSDQFLVGLDLSYETYSSGEVSISGTPLTLHFGMKLDTSVLFLTYNAKTSYSAEVGDFSFDLERSSNLSFSYSTPLSETMTLDTSVGKNLNDEKSSSGDSYDPPPILNSLNILAQVCQSIDNNQSIAYGLSRNRENSSIRFAKLFNQESLRTYNPTTGLLFSYLYSQEEKKSYSAYGFDLEYHLGKSKREFASSSGSSYERKQSSSYLNYSLSYWTKF